MAQRITTSFINTNRPGSYFDVKVKSTPVGVASSGNIVIIGEAAGGPKYDAEDLKENFYTPDQLDRVTAKYISGPIVDAFRALSAPSSDANITGSANRIYIVKTNGGSQAQATVATAYGTLKDKNFGRMVKCPSVTRCQNLLCYAKRGHLWAVLSYAYNEPCTSGPKI